MVANLAERAGELRPEEKARFYGRARRSATEIAAWLDLIGVRREVPEPRVQATAEPVKDLVPRLVRARARARARKLPRSPGTAHERDGRARAAPRGTQELVARVARPAILERIDPARHLVLEASAGTGKTYVLEHLVADLVLRGAAPLEQILVVTFTDKATREMRERVRATLRRVLDEGPEPAAGEAHWLVDDAARARVRDALAVFDRAPISTIHSFCQRVLSECAFDCARLLRQEQVDSRDAFGRAFREELRRALAADDPLRPVIEGALDRLGGAERLETILYGWSVERGAWRPGFDRERAREALAAMPTRRDLAPGGLVARLLEDELSRQPKKTVPEALRELAPLVDAVRADRPILDALLDYWAWAGAPRTSGHDNASYVLHYLGRSPRLAPLAARARALVEAAGSPSSVLVGELLPRVVARLRRDKGARGRFDFDDMLSMLADALHGEGGDALVRELRRRYRYALVDEFQDTDPVQWDVFSTLFVAHEGDERLVVIGDPKQAIYGFRNADVHTYLAAKRALVARGGDVVPLETCYRSSPAFLDALNQVLTRGFFTGVNEYPHPVRAGRTARRLLDARGDDAPPIALVHLVGRPALRAAWISRALAGFVAREIGRLLAGALSVERGDGPRPILPSDVHVLCRSGADAEAVRRALTGARIPHALYKQEGLFATPAARHVWEVLRAVEDPSDRVRRLRAWLTPFFAVPLARIDECRDVPSDHPLQATLRSWRALADQHRFADLFRSMLTESGLVRRELFAGRSERDLTDTQHVLEVLLEEAHRGRRSLGQLVTRLGAFIAGRELPAGESGDVQRLESEHDAVQILTMHKSKGLEAEVVFLVGGLGEPSPDRFAPRVVHEADGTRLAWLGEPPAPLAARVEEERRQEAERLLYVAMTRAKSRLYVPYFGAPPADAPPVEGASYELADEPPPPAPERQLALDLEDPGAPAEDPPDYRLKAMSGPYRVLNERLGSMVAEGAITAPGFERTVVEVRPPRRAGRPIAAVLSGVRLDAVREPDEDDLRFARARRERAGFDITSYTRMKRQRREAGYDEGLEALAGAAEPDVGAPPSPDELPGGSAVGVFLHEVLEHARFEGAAEAAWLTDPALVALVTARARHNGVAERFVPIAAALVRDALTTPLALPDGRRLEGGMAAFEACARELPFLLPIPEPSHPPLDAGRPRADGPALAIERGFLRGVIDLVGRHAGRYYVVDYKSDRLASYAADALGAHVEAEYAVQARLYTLGAVRALRIHDEADYDARFGGLLYTFLRGMPAAGVWSARPSWQDVLSWERALHADAPWDHPLPPRRALAFPG
ncbi:MAG: UvrD-helicase domain-containing protein [Sandaracinaceae bacterium]|nr:UvrD-helicase domain-containing protein [Sandaracinaceae bacterium]